MTGVQTCALPICVAIGRPSTRIFGIPDITTAAEQLGLNPGACGFVGLPCVATILPMVATGRPSITTEAISDSTSPGGPYSGFVWSPTSATANGILSYDSAFGYRLNSGSSFNVM